MRLLKTIIQSNPNIKTIGEKRALILKKHIVSFLIIAVSVLTLVGSGFAMYFVIDSSKSKNLINVDIENGETKSIEFQKLDIVPGETVKYVVKLNTAVDGDYDILFDFNEIEDRSLKNYVYIKVEKNGEVICEELLADVLEGDGKTYVYTGDISDGSEINISYSMPEDVGNEAKSAKTSFELRITLSTAEDVNE